ncbi:hypothetical protein NHF48_002120 [Sphingomonas sp. H160509]|uniref:hypothetical protein n=1 Tax=Sphingomonas sp. H160509 TaxID=2955313 RepID=UPI002097B786|nr:hypothetical protein [Sphingomonas sp. H160509]MDD1450014.1 hypothetical protein [Sphingomonas sp. H160509]
MATEQPNIAPDDMKPEPNDADSAATVLDDAQMTETPGGGGSRRCRCRGCLERIGKA